MRHSDRPEQPAAPSTDVAVASRQQIESVSSIVSDVEEFARNWIGRIRELIQRSAQLIERETLLASAIARLDQQKAEWTKRTAAKEANLRDQAKRLTEAWLEVESERRKQIQGARVAAVNPATPGGSDRPNCTAMQQPLATGPVTARPPGQQSSPVINTPPVGPATVASAASAGSGTGGQGTFGTGQTRPSPSPLPVSANVQNAPVSAGPPVASSRHDDPQDDGAAEQQKRQRIEEFRRMQRSIQSNRNT